jgi:Mg2+ and Co2+ transporter CorA
MSDEPRPGTRNLRYEEVVNATERELIEALPPGPYVFVTASDLLAELDRRRTRAIAERMEGLNREVRDLTQQVKDLTSSIRILTLAALLVAITAVLVALRSAA